MSSDWREILYTLIKWCIENAIEIIATITGILYLMYSVRASVLLWPFGLITSFLYVYVFCSSKIYADMGINIYYVLVSIYGWIHWYLGKENNNEVPISYLSRKQWLFVLISCFILYFIIVFILKKYTDSDVPYLDSFTTAASVVATWMLARKIIEHWLFWVVIDALSIGLYMYKKLYPTVFLFIIYTVFAIAGYYEWKKMYNMNMIKSE